MIEAADETRCSNLQSGDDVLQPADYLGKPVLRLQGLRHPAPGSIQKRFRIPEEFCLNGP